MPGMLWRRRCLLNAAYSTHNTQNILSPPQDIAARGPFRSNATAREYLGAVNQQGASNEVLNGHATNRNFDVDIARYTRGAVRPGGGGESLRSVGVSLGGVWQHLCDAVERGHRLHERYDGQRGECELRGELVDAGRESHEQQWRCWQRAAVDLERVLLGVAGAIGFLRGGVERERDLYGRHGGQRGAYQLRGELVDAGSESLEQQRRSGGWPAVDAARILLDEWIWELAARRRVDEYRVECDGLELNGWVLSGLSGARFDGRVKHHWRRWIALPRGVRLTPVR